MLKLNLDSLHRKHYFRKLKYNPTSFETTCRPLEIWLMALQNWLHFSDLNISFMSLLSNYHLKYTLTALTNMFASLYMHVQVSCCCWEKKYPKKGHFKNKCAHLFILFRLSDQAHCRILGDYPVYLYTWTHIVESWQEVNVQDIFFFLDVLGS